MRGSLLAPWGIVARRGFVTSELNSTNQAEYDLTMAKLTLELPDELSDRLGARAVEEGYGSVEAYVAGLIRDDVEEVDFGVPDHLRVRSASDLEAKLMEGLASPASEMTDGDWAEMRGRLIERHGGAK